MVRYFSRLSLVLPLIIIVLTFSGCTGPATTPEQAEASDSRITIVLDKVERVDSIPADMVEAITSPLRPYKAPAPAEGCDFVCVYLIIARIENVHVVDPLGYEGEEALLFDAQNHEYSKIIGSVQIIFLDIHDPQGGAEAVEGSTGYFVFEVSKHKKPSKFRFVYSFKETLEEETAKRGQIDINL